MEHQNGRFSAAVLAGGLSSRMGRDKAALDCQKDQRLITMSSSGVKAAMLQNATVAAENVGIMKLRRQIRKMLGAEDDR